MRHAIAVLAVASATFVCAQSALAQGASCLKPHPVTLGDNPFACQDTFDVQLSQSTSGFGEAFIYRAGWFAFTPDVTAQYIIGLCGVNADSKLALGAGCPIAADIAWDVLGYNDDACAFTGGSGLWASKLQPGNVGRPLNAPLVAGQTYLICVGGYGFSTPSVAGSLSIEMVPPPLDPCASVPVAAIGANALPMHENAPTLTTECGGILYDISRTGYLRFTAPYTGQFIAGTCGAQADTVMAVLTSCGNGASSIGCNDDSCGGASQVAFNATAGQDVYIGVGLYDPTAALPASIGVLIEEAAPPADPCSQIGVLSMGVNTLALDSTMPDLVIPSVPAATVYKVNYFTFTAPQAGVFRISNCTHTDFDSIIFRASACNSGAAVQEANDDGCNIVGGPSRLSFFSEAGATTVIGVGAWSGIEPLPAATVINATFLAPPSLPCETANVIQGAVGTNLVNMSLAYRSLDLAGHCDPGPDGTDAIACARMIRFTAGRSGPHTVGTCADADPTNSARFDSRLAVLADCGSAASVLACNDDGCVGGANPYASKLTFTAVAGSTYYIAVGGFDEFAVGPFHVTIEEPTGVAGDVNGDGSVNGIDLALLLGQWGGPGSADIDGSGLVGGADLALLLNAWTN